MAYKGKKNNKKNANYKLEKTQLIKLNKEFYENFHVNYYNIKLITMMDMISNTYEYKEYINNKSIFYDKASTKVEDVDELEINKFAKIELNNMYFHCIETFIRLFIAHGKDTECPWLEMCDLDIYSYRKYVKNISKGNISCINKNMSEEEVIMYVFTGHRKSIDEVGISNDDYNNIKDWIIWSAHELLSNAQYNSYKHGMAIYPSSNKISIMGGGKQIKAEGETLRYLKKSEKQDRFVWNKEEKFISYDTIITMIFTINKMSEAILSIGKYMHVENEEYKMGWLPAKGWSVDFIRNNKTDNAFGMEISSISEELIYYK